MRPTSLLLTLACVPLTLAACGARSGLPVDTSSGGSSTSSSSSSSTSSSTSSSSGQPGCDDSPSPDCVDCNGDFVLAECKGNVWVCPVFVCACEPAVWQETATGNGTQSGSAVAVAKDGSVLVGGVFGGTINLGGSTFPSSEPEIFEVDAVVARLTPDGAHVWSRSFGAVGDDWIEDLDFDTTGHALVLGAYRSAQSIDGFMLPDGTPRSLFLSKHLPTGEAVWAQAFVGGANGTYGRLATLPDGGMVIAGTTSGTLTWSGGALTGGNAPEAFVIRLDGDGNTLWARRFPATINSFANDVAVSSSGQVYLVGGFRGTIDFGTGPLDSQGGFDIFLARLSPDGQPDSASAFGGPGDDIGHRIVVDLAGRQTIMATYQDGADLGGGPLSTPDLGGVVARYIGDFIPAWQVPFSGVSDEIFGEEVWQIGVNSFGSVVLAGGFQGTFSIGGQAVTSSGDYDVGVATLDMGGAVLRVCAYGSPLYDAVGALAVDAPDNAVLLTGTYFATIDFGLGELSNDQNGEMYFVKLPNMQGF